MARIAARIDRKNGSASKRVEVFRPLRDLEIAIEHDVRRSAEPALDQVHEQKGEIVEDVAGRDQIAELDGVEQHRPAVDQDDVAEMQIAMDTTDEATPAALDQQRMNAPIGGAAPARASSSTSAAGNRSGISLNAPACSSI